MGAPNSAWQRDTEAVSSEIPSTESQGQQRMFLLRLRRLIWLRRSCAGQLEDSILRALDMSIYSTYCDCLEVGVGDEARQLLKQTSKQTS